MDTPNSPAGDKKSFKAYITSLSRKVSQKTVSGAQHLGTLARSATISTGKRKSKGSKQGNTPATTASLSQNSQVPAPPRLPNVIYRSPDADFIESHMEARIRSIGTNGEAEKADTKEEDDRMGGYTIRVIDPRINGT